MNLAVTHTPLRGLCTVQRHPAGDARGFFSRLFSLAELQAHGWHGAVNQVNHSYTARRGSVRGLHYQRAPHADAKLVQCIRGEVWDVAVDLRRGSPTFLQWHAQVLSADNGLGLYIPEGFAHGFQALTDDVELIYCHTAQYVPAAEGGLNYLDARLAIPWPQAATDISERDRHHPLINTGFEGLDP